MDRRTFVTTIGATVAGAGLAGCGDPGPGAETPAEDGAGDTPGGVSPGRESPIGETPGVETTPGDGAAGGEATEDGGETAEGTPADDGAGDETPGGETPAGGAGVGEDVSGSVGEIDSGLEVQNHDFFQSEGGGAVVGNVVNTGSDTYDVVAVEVVMYDENGDAIETMGVSSEDDLDQLPPEEMWWFLVEFERDIGDVAEYELNVGGQMADGEGEDGETPAGEETETPTAGDS